MSQQKRKKTRPLMLKLAFPQSRLHPIEQYIGFFQYSKTKQKPVLYARCYKVDWGNYLNESGTWIGMYCKALDKEISTLLSK
jgi:hypothetical protein